MTTTGRYSKARLAHSIKEGLSHWSTSQRVGAEPNLPTITGQVVRTFPSDIKGCQYDIKGGQYGRV